MSKMRCPYCSNDNSQVRDSRSSEDHTSIRRRRFCEQCGSRFTTYERIEVDKQDLGKHSKEKKKDFYRKVLKDLIEDLEGRTYLEKKEDSTLWEEV